MLIGISTSGKFWYTNCCFCRLSCEFWMCMDWWWWRGPWQSDDEVCPLAVHKEIEFYEIYFTRHILEDQYLFSQPSFHVHNSPSQMVLVVWMARKVPPVLAYYSKKGTPLIDAWKVFWTLWICVASGFLPLLRLTMVPSAIIDNKWADNFVLIINLALNINCSVSFF